MYAMLHNTDGMVSMSSWILLVYHCNHQLVMSNILSQCREFDTRIVCIVCSLWQEGLEDRTEDLINKYQVLPQSDLSFD